MAAKLWEDTVVTALRDAQWMSCKGHALPQTFPPGFVKLDGNAESALGDLLYSSGERYYLIEVKSGRDEICSEWLDKDGKYKEKLVYSTLSHLWRELETFAAQRNSPEKELALKSIVQSTSCHHFAYWNEWTVGKFSTGEVVIEPYIAACLDLFDPDKVPKKSGIRRWNDNLFLLGKETNGEILAGKALSVQKMLSESSRCFAVATKHGGLHERNSYPIGLPFLEFQEYINTLTDNAGNGELDLHAIILSSSGRVFKSISSTADLRNVLNPDLLEVKSAEQKLKIIHPSKDGSPRSTTGLQKYGSSRS
ncbi:hypothetical protein [Xanthomonas campestris]|uniref:hypothetical protein n=1 Tax=Xanthomonas campestris TaxID=339 RepID=UPI0011C3F133|nr:hypothetical protein [Xanthomonas campestris]